MTCYKCGKETGTPFAECERCAYGHPDIGVEIKSVEEMRDMSSAFDLAKIFETNESLREFLSLYLVDAPPGVSLEFLSGMFISRDIRHRRIVKGLPLHEHLKKFLICDPEPPRQSGETEIHNPIMIMKYQSSFRIDRTEAIDLYFKYIKEAKRCVREALNWKNNPILSKKDPCGYQDWLRWAKEAAAKARRWANKLDTHFGTMSLSQRCHSFDPLLRQAA